MTPLAGAVKTLRLLADGQVDVVLSFEPKDRVAVMQMMGSPGQPIACVPLAAGFAAAPAEPKAGFRDLGPICRESIDLCQNEKFLDYIATQGSWKKTPEAAKGFILACCGGDSRKELDEPERRNLFIQHVRKPFHAWLSKQERASGRLNGTGY